MKNRIPQEALGDTVDDTVVEDVAAFGVLVDPAADGVGGDPFGPGFEGWLTQLAAESEAGVGVPPDPVEEARRPGVGRVVSELYGPRLDDLLDDIAEDESALAMRAARRARSVDAARVWALGSDEFVLPNARMSDSERFGFSMRCFLSEVATRQHLSEVMAGRLVEESRMLVTELPGTLEALECARISYRHAQTIIDQARTLPVGVRAGFEEAVLPEAARLPVARFRKVAVRAREYLHPDSIADRTRAATQERRFAFDPAEDGMAWVSAYLPADRAQALFNRVTAIAKSLQGRRETRTLSQLRADVASQLLLNGHVPDAPGSTAPISNAPSPTAPSPNAPGSDEHPDCQNPGGLVSDGRPLGGVSGWRVPGSGQPDPGGVGVSRRERRWGKRKGPNWGIRPTVIVTVPVMTLLGHSDEPGTLDGYGPIDADTARRLAAQAPSFRRLLTHPETGVALSLGTETYRVPKDLRLWLHLRDGVCRFPGCTRPAIHSDLDHSRAAGFGGPTDAANLAALCGPHHRLKHATTWTVTNQGNGILDWTSPTGKTYTTYPATTLPHPTPPATGGTGGEGGGTGPAGTGGTAAAGAGAGNGAAAAAAAAAEHDPPPQRHRPPQPPPRESAPPPVADTGTTSPPVDPSDEAPPF